MRVRVQLRAPLLAVGYFSSLCALTHACLKPASGNSEAWNRPCAEWRFLESVTLRCGTMRCIIGVELCNIFRTYGPRRRCVLGFRKIPTGDARMSCPRLRSNTSEPFACRHEKRVSSEHMSGRRQDINSSSSRSCSCVMFVRIMVGCTRNNHVHVRNSRANNQKNRNHRPNRTARLRTMK